MLGTPGPVTRERPSASLQPPGIAHRPRAQGQGDHQRVPWRGMNTPHPNYRIVEHDPAWGSVFVAERERIAAVLGLPQGRIEHIGSTAVPGLGAKPIVDIMAGAESESDYASHGARLKGLGYEDRGETVPGTRYIRKAGPPRVNLHLTVFGGEFWAEHLLFRDFLREHGETAREYERLKRQVLAGLGPDPPAYNAARAGFINAVLARARAGRGDERR